MIHHADTSFSDKRFYCSDKRTELTGKIRIRKQWWTGKLIVQIQVAKITEITQVVVGVEKINQIKHDIVDSLWWRDATEDDIEMVEKSTSKL